MSEQTGKSRALRIRLDYHKQKGALYWARWLAAGLAFAVSGSYGVLVLVAVLGTSGDAPPSRNASWFSRATLQVSSGPLAEAHAHFDSDCGQCHAAAAMHAIATDAFKLHPSASVGSLAAACQRCHQVQSHVAGVDDAACHLLDQNCAECHAEHRGRNVDLAAVTSAHCTQCHADINRACPDRGAWQQDRLLTNISDFSIESHAVEGSFRSLSTDTGRIKFDHAQHLNAGQIEQDQRGGFRFDMLLPRWQANYDQSADGLVQLNCDNCHKLQSPAGPLAVDQLSGTEAATDLELSHFYAPIDFESHCVACHQMTFAGQTTNMLPIPHAAPADEVRGILSAKLISGKLSGQIRSSPVEEVSGVEQPPSAAVQVLEQVELESAVAAVFERCQQCHLADDVSDANIKARLSGALRPLIPHNWLKRGQFDHGAHATISECGFCHEVRRDAQELGQATPPYDNQYVMIKGPKSCVPCHRQAKAEPSAAASELSLPEQRASLLGNVVQPTMASANCTLCHRYHWSRPPLTAESSVDSLPAGGAAVRAKPADDHRAAVGDGS